MLHAGAAVSSGVGVSTLQKLAFLRSRASQHQLHQPVLPGSASPGNHDCGSEGSNPVQQVYGVERQLPTCSFEMAQPTAPQQPWRLREYLQEQQLTVNEAAVIKSLPFGRHSPPAVATHSHADSAAGCNHADSSLHPASTTSETLCSPNAGLCYQTRVHGRRHTEDLSHLSGCQLQAVRRVSYSRPPLGMGRSKSTTERRRSMLGMPPSGLLSGLEGAAAETDAAVSRSSTPPVFSSCSRASVSVNEIYRKVVRGRKPARHQTSSQRPRHE